MVATKTQPEVVERRFRSGSPMWQAGTACAMAVLALLALPPASADFATVGQRIYAQSPDGVDWVQPTASPHFPLGLHKVAYGNGVWVAVGGGYDYVWRSTDAQHWSLVNPAPPMPGFSVGFSSGAFTIPFFFRDITFANGQFVAVGLYDAATNTQLVHTSPDGLSWTMHHAPQEWLLTQQGIAYGQGKYVSVGVGGSMMWSLDGALWVIHHTGQANDLWGVEYDGQGLWTAVGNGGTILTSPDALIWSPAGWTVPDDLFAVTYGNGKWVVTGAGGQVLESANGAAWSAQSLGSWLDLRDVFHGNGLYVTIAEQPANFSSRSSALYISSDGTNWQSRPLNAEWIWGAYGITYGGGWWISVGGNTLSRSRDGLDWISGAPTTGFEQYAVASNGTGWVSVGWRGSLFTGPDGQNWTARYSGTQQPFHGVTWGAGQWVAVGGCENGSCSHLRTSVDGIHWSEQVSPMWGDPDLRSVTHGPLGFVVVGEKGRVLQSWDGTSWTIHSSGTSATLNGIAYGNGTYVAVGAKGVILTSPNGTNWTSRTSGTSVDLHGITFAVGQDPPWVAVGNNATVHHSRDGITWSAASVPSGAPHLTSVAFADGRWVAVGPGPVSIGPGKIVGSADGKSWSVLPYTLIATNPPVPYNFPQVPYAVGSDAVAPLECGPAHRNAKEGELVLFGAHGGQPPYSWDRVGSDGGSSDGALAIVSYADAGEYQVTLTDSAIPPATSLCTVSVDGPPRCDPASLQVFAGGSHLFTVRSGKPPYSWADPGTGQQVAGNAFTASFPLPGDEQVTVTDKFGRTSTCLVRVVDPLAPLCEPVDGEIMHLTAATFVASGGDGFYEWSTARGTPEAAGPLDANTPFVATYASGGEHWVTVTSAGKTGRCAVQVLEFCGPDVAAQFQARASYVANGQQVVFHDESIGNVGTRKWSFGDGFSSSEKDPLHAYAGPGNYRPRLWVTEAGSGCVSLYDMIVKLGPTPQLREPLLADPDCMEQGAATLSSPVLPSDGLDQVVTVGSKVRLGPLTDEPRKGGPAHDAHESPEHPLGLTYHWLQVRGTKVELTDARSASPTFDAPGSPEGLMFAVCAMDGTATGAPVFATVHVVDGNHAPVALAGRMRDALGAESVRLDGSSSYDPDGDALSFSWSWQGGDMVDLTGPETVTPSFVAPRAPVQGFTDIQLTVSDGELQSSDIVRIWIWQPQTTPTRAVPAQHQPLGPDAEAQVVAVAPSPFLPLIILGVFAFLAAVAIAAWRTKFRQRLQALGVILLFSRLRQGDLLGHPARTELLEHIRNDPGINCSTLVQLTGRGRGNVQHHLAVLVRGGLVEERQWNGTRGYTLAGEQAGIPFQAIAVLRSDAARRIWNQAKTKPEASARELAQNLDIPRSTVSFYLRKFRDAGLLQ